MTTFKEVPFDTLYENNLAKKAGAVLVECDPTRSVLKIIEACITKNNTVLSNAELADWILRYYVDRTRRHMRLVRICSEKLQTYFKFHGLSHQFTYQCENHDQDKFSGNEHMAMYALACPLYTYPDLYEIKPEARQAYEEIEWPKHYALNVHHPEHYMKQPDPTKEEFVISDEELEEFFNKKWARAIGGGHGPLLAALGEMVADWMAVSLEKGGSAKEWWLKNKNTKWTYGPKYTEVIEAILSYEPAGLVVDMDPLPEPPEIKPAIDHTKDVLSSSESLEFAPIENFDELNLEYGPEGWFDDVSEKDATHYTIRNFPVAAFFNKLKKEYKTTKLEHLFTSIGIGFFSTRNRTITIHKFFVPELLYLLNKFKFPVSLINTIRSTTWVGVKPAATCAVDMSRIKKNMTCELYPHQEEFIKCYPNNKDENNLRGYLLSFDQGLGKTITSLALMEALGKETIIILCPKNTMRETWETHIDKFYNKPQTRYIAGTRDLLTPNRRFYIFNYDRIDEVKLFLAQNRFKNLGIIVDESHNFLRTASQRTQLLMDIAEIVDKSDMLLMSGTPVKATGIELVPMLRVLDPLFNDEALEIFKRTFGFNTNIANDVLHARLSRMMTRVTKTILDLPAKNEQTILVKMKTGYKYTVSTITKGIVEFVKERQRYYDAHMHEYNAAFDEVLDYLCKHPDFAYDRDFERWYDIIEWLRSANISDARGNAEIVWANQYEKEVIIPALPDDLKKKFLWSKSAVKYAALKIKGEVIGSYLMKLRMQMTSEMLEAADIKHIVDNAMKKTIVFTSYVDTIETAQQYFVANGYKPLCVYGKNAGELTNTVARFQEKQEYNPLIASLKMLSTGATLTAANTVIFLNKPWRSIEYQQASDRVHRIGQDTECFIYSLVLDTGKEENLSTRMEDIMNWSEDQFEQIVDKQELAMLQKKFGKGLEGFFGDIFKKKPKEYDVCLSAEDDRGLALTNKAIQYYNNHLKNEEFFNEQHELVILDDAFTVLREYNNVANFVDKLTLPRSGESDDEYLNRLKHTLNLSSEAVGAVIKKTDTVAANKKSVTYVAGKYLDFGKVKEFITLYTRLEKKCGKFSTMWDNHSEKVEDVWEELGIADFYENVWNNDLLNGIYHQLDVIVKHILTVSNGLSTESYSSEGLTPDEVESSQENFLKTYVSWVEAKNFFDTKHVDDLRKQLNKLLTREKDKLNISKVLNDSLRVFSDAYFVLPATISADSQEYVKQVPCFYCDIENHISAGMMEKKYNTKASLNVRGITTVDKYVTFAMKYVETCYNFFDKLRKFYMANSNDKFKTLKERTTFGKRCREAFSHTVFSIQKLLDLTKKMSTDSRTSNEALGMEAESSAPSKIAQKKKKIIDYICKLCDTMEPSGLNSRRYRGMLEKMTDKEFDQFMHYMKDGKWQLHIVAPNMIVNLKNEDLLKACDLIGLDLFQRVWMHDVVTGRKYLTDNKYMFLQLPIRRQQQFLDEKMSVPDNDKQIDQLTGQVTGDSRSCSITNPEIQILAARGLTSTLQELVNVRGGNINNYNEFRRSLEETGEADLDTLDPNSRTRASVVMGKLLQSMMLDTNL